MSGGAASFPPGEGFASSFPPGEGFAAATFPRIAALFVNYNSGEYVANAVSSLLAQRVDDRPADVEIVVVDNASPERERDRPHLEKIRREHGARLIWNERNDGFSGGMVRALAASTAPLLAAINPDVLFAPGALERCLRCLLSSEEIGMVGPCGFLDRDRLVHLPINALPTLDDEIARFRGRFSAEASLAYSIPRARETHRVNRAREPIDVGMLSGACMLLRRATVDRIGFFDPIYPLFYEDGDLCRRVHAAGLRVVHVPDAPITHFVSRSVMTAPKSDDPMRRWADSRRRYFRRWYGPLGEAFVDRLDREMPKRHRFAGKPATPCADLGRIDRAPTVRFDRPAPEAMIEIALDSGFYLAASAYGAGDSWTFPEAGWQTFFSGTPVFLRALDVRDYSVIGTWTFTTPRR